jgi:TetR/AcrR family transcriptional regulator, transcriptional repressor for nem operon
MPRAKAFDPEVALDRAVDLFWRLGYEGASMTRLLAHMGISRQSLYDTFGDKHKLYLAALDRYRAQARERLAEIVYAEPTTLAGIRAAFDWVRRDVLEQPEHRSCLMANAALELGQRDAEVRERVAEHLREVEAVFFTALERGQARGEIEPKRDARGLARMLTNAIHGLGVLARGGASPPALRETITTTLALLPTTH